MEPEPEPEATNTEQRALRVAIVGRPNAGKSTLVNAILRQERMITGPEPGLTRDSIASDLEWDGRAIRLFDTAGLRRKGRTEGALDKLAAVMARRSLERADLALVVLDAAEGVTTQDARIAGYAEAAGRAVVLVVNKWDLIGAADRAPELVRSLRERLPFLAHAPVVFTSARDGDLASEVDVIRRQFRRQPSRPAPIPRSAEDREGTLARIEDGRGVVEPPGDVAETLERLGCHFMDERLFERRACCRPIGAGSGAPGSLLDGLTIACGEGAVRLTQVQREGKAAMDAATFLRGAGDLPAVAT